jgi:molybdopterin guanine dinucleotide-containing S/N-oxide reductase-like protein
MSEKRIEKVVEDEKIYLKGLGLCSFGMGSNVSKVHVKNGRIVRITPLDYNWKYDPEKFNPWEMEARSKRFKQPLKSLNTPLSTVYKKRVYSPNRIKYPLKRVDWDPKGDRNVENRGKSKFVRISWDEATDIIADEIKRIHEKYGPYAILCQADGHGETKTVHGPHGCSTKLLQLMGGFTLQCRNPDSWEGWWWGSKHVWGMEPLGQQLPQSNVYKDISENTDLLLFWGCDPETTPWAFNGQIASQWCQWFKELGIKSIYVCPDLNYGAAVHADKWIPIQPNTDAALHLAIAYTWITAGTYDKEYVATHTHGFEEFKKYVLGDEDGIPKTPKWAAERCGVPSRTIKALAREWASKRTSIEHNQGGSLIRGPYSTEPARLEVLLLAMQGVGKPGVHQARITEITLGELDSPNPRPLLMPNVMAGYRGWALWDKLPKQHIPKTLIHEAILNPPISWYSTTIATAPTQDQFVKYQYPVEGCSEIHMIWTDTPCWTTCWNDGHTMQKALRSPKIEFILAQHPWMENDCLFADIILPSNTKLEEEDIGTDIGGSGQFFSIFYEGQCIQPIGESKSDYETVGEIAKKLELYEEYTGGKTVKDWIRIAFENSGVTDKISWEEFMEKGYYVVPIDPNWQDYPVGMTKFYEDPESNPMQTPTGKIEFYATGLAEHFPDDEERPPVPHWIPEGESHQESLQCARAEKYPFLIISNHPRWRVHAQYDDATWFREIPTCKVKGPDGYLYEPIWINPVDAEKLGVKDGDVVKLFNERGAVLGGAYVTERIMPGVIYQDHGARVDPIVPGELDRGGANNLIAPRRTTSKNATGMATSGFLAGLEKVNIEELREQYPEAFEREYDPAAGLRFDARVDGGKEK